MCVILEIEIGFEYMTLNIMWNYYITDNTIISELRLDSYTGIIQLLKVLKFIN